MTTTTTHPDWLAALAAHAEAADVHADWPAASLQAARLGAALRWSIPQAFGGDGLDRVAQLRATERLASACLTTAFVLSQREAAIRWLLDPARPVGGRYLPGLARGDLFATVGLSQLTTSRQHRPPSLVATPVGPPDSPHAYRLDGEVPWVTGADHADLVVTGAALSDDRQIVLAVPRTLAGVTVGPPLPLAAVVGSRTAAVRCDAVEVPADHVVAGPGPRLVRSGGGLDTSCLAIGLAVAAVDYLRIEAARRPDVAPAATRLDAALAAARDRLHALAGEATPDADAVLALRVDCTRLVLRATQAALAVAKGTGFVTPHPVQRWVRQAAFFLVWSCPQPVAAAVLADLTAV